MSKIITPSSVKRMFEHAFSNLFSQRGLPDNISFARTFIIGISRIDDLRENFIKNLKKHNLDIKIINQALDDYPNELFKAQLLTRNIRELNTKSKGQGISENIIQELKKQIIELNSEIPLINDYLLNAFFCAYNGTDLEDVEIPKEPIMHPELYDLEDIQKREREEME